MSQLPDAKCSTFNAKLSHEKQRTACILDALNTISQATFPLIYTVREARHLDIV